MPSTGRTTGKRQHLRANAGRRQGGWAAALGLRANRLLATAMQKTAAASDARAWPIPVGRGARARQPARRPGSVGRAWTTPCIARAARRRRGPPSEVAGMQKNQSLRLGGRRRGGRAAPGAAGRRRRRRAHPAHQPPARRPGRHGREPLRRSMARSRTYRSTQPKTAAAMPAATAADPPHPATPIAAPAASATATHATTATIAAATALAIPSRAETNRAAPRKTRYKWPGRRRGRAEAASLPRPCAPPGPRPPPRAAPRTRAPPGTASGRRAPASSPAAVLTPPRPLPLASRCRRPRAAPPAAP